MANVTDNEERYLRQILLLGKGGCLVLRALVNREKDKDGRSLEDILTSSKTKLQKVLLKFQFNYIFPSGTNVNADIETWDISLLISIISNLFGHVTLEDNDALNEIREIRNKILGHNSSYSLTEGTYNELRLELNENILKLASDKATKIECYKIISYSGTGQLTNDTVLKELNALHAFEGDQLSCLNERFGESKSKLECIGEEVNEVKNKLDTFERNDGNRHAEGTGHLRRFHMTTIYQRRQDIKEIKGNTRTIEINQGKRQEKLNKQLQVIDVGVQSKKQNFADESSDHRQTTRLLGILQSPMHDDVIETKSLTKDILDIVTERGTIIDSAKRKITEEADGGGKKLKSEINDRVTKITEALTANKDVTHNRFKERHDETEQKRQCLNMADIEQLWSAGKTNQYLKECERICTFIKNKSDNIVCVWPAYDTNEDKALIFVVMATENVEVDVEYRLYIRIVGQYSEEGECVMRNRKNAENRLSAEQSEKICNVINLLADTLMQNHRFISIITGSGVRSVKFATKNEEIIPEVCVVIYVVIKGKIPLDEKEIPKSLEGIPVDIREGDFQTSVLTTSAFHTNVQMGCQIMSTGNQYGTLGGFVEHPEYGLCGITCAHVVLNEQEMHDLKDKENVALCQRNIYQPDNTHPDHIVGPVKGVTYHKGGGDGVPGIDLAVFQIKNRPPECGNFPGISEKDLVYESGKLGVENQFMTDDKQVVKFGSRSGFTRGHVVFCATSVREIKYTDYTRKYTVENKDYTYTLHNQLDIEPSFYGPFNIGGDSGGLVFTKDVTENWICIGMVVGAYTNGNGIVTPISAIKRQLGVSEFKNFTSNKIDRLAKQMKTMETYMQMICSKLGIREIAVTSRAPANQGQKIAGGQKDNTHVYSHSEGCQ